MTLLILAYLGGVLTIASPCILPVLPFVLARAHRPFASHGLPLLLGMALAFTAVATLAAVGGGWAVQANAFGRLAALLLLAAFALTLLLPTWAERLARPLVALGARISASGDSVAAQRGFAPSLLLGAASGLLWAPCAGPILGLILTGAALHGANVGTSLLLLAYAAGACTSLALALGVGGRVYSVLQRSLGLGVWLRRGMGAAVLAGVALVATGLDTWVLSQLALNQGTAIEQRLVEQLTPASDTPAGWDMLPPAAKPSPLLRTGFQISGAAEMPGFDGAQAWINSAPLRAEDLRGKVVLVDFWTYSCINCLRTLPYVRAWAEKYKDAGLVVVGVHSPEFAFEKDLDHVRRAVKDQGITYPVAVDSNHAIWRAFRNQYWPALYFVDAQGQVRHHIFGEGQYAEAEKVIQALLAENGRKLAANALVAVHGDGVQAAPGERAMSDETYVGYARAENFAPAGGLVADRPQRYRAAPALKLNQWTLGGDWNVEPERAVVAQPGASLAYRFRARDLHLVLGRAAGTQPLRFRVRVDGQPPLAGHGSDVAEDGGGVLDAHRLYQLLRLPSSAGEHLFEIEFLDAGAYAYAFTFG
ncbi:cytochrome c biogenesis protein DipZ [Rhodoferax sp.]|uniref:cytochrome c biogenesis protein DipZ n=1 Tax=Rhodoferax sp. TaxID=50421 RepID=UPI00374DA50A